jgi:hypothetical protein
VYAPIAYVGPVLAETNVDTAPAPALSYDATNLSVMSNRFAVVNNSTDPNTKKRIEEESKNLDLRTIDSLNNVSGNPSVSHSQSFQYILKDLSESDVAMVLDHDIFLFNNLEASYFEKYDIVMLSQTRGHVEYPWPGCLIFNKIKRKDSISITPVNIEGNPCDTGGSMHYYLRENDLNIKRINETYFDFNQFRCANLDDIFLHMMAGSGWNGAGYLEEKLRFIKEKTGINE